MKAGRTLTDLVAELERRQATKKDMIVNTAKMRLEPRTDGSQQLVLADREAFAINKLAHDQIATHTAIPTAYYRKMLTEAPDLLANNVNEWFKKYPADRTVRTLDGTARALLSNMYRPLDDYDLAEAVVPVLLDMGVEIMSCDLTETRFFLKVVDEKIRQDIPTGKKLGDGSHCFFDTVSPGAVISNSEVGFGNLSVETALWTKVCTNLATIPQQGSIKRRHVGSRNALAEAEDIRHLLTDETRRLNDKAVFATVKDVVKASFDELRFKKYGDKLRGAVEDRIEDPIKVVELSAKKFGLSDIVAKAVQRTLIEGADLTRYGLHAAITRASQDDAIDYDTASDLERLGGRVIELGRAEWRELVAA